MTKFCHKGRDKNAKKKLNTKKTQIGKPKAFSANPVELSFERVDNLVYNRILTKQPKEYWTGYKLHEQTQTCFYCMGEKATINIDGKQYPPIGADGATVVICNILYS